MISVINNISYITNVVSLVVVVISISIVIVLYIQVFFLEHDFLEKKQTYL